MPERYVIQGQHGARQGVRGVKILIRPPIGQGKCITAHGYTVEELHELIYFMLFHKDFIMNDKVRRMIACRKDEKWKRKKSWS